MRSLVGAGLVDPVHLQEYYEQIEPEPFRYPAVDPPTLRRALEQLVAGL